MDKLDFLIERLLLLEQRMTMLEGARGVDRNQTILTMQEMSRTIGMMMAQLLPIINDRRVMKVAIEEAAIEQVFEHVKKTQKYPM
jgi:hypothetical protein